MVATVVEPNHEPGGLSQCRRRVYASQSLIRDPDRLRKNMRHNRLFNKISVKGFETDQWSFIVWASCFNPLLGLQ